LDTDAAVGNNPSQDGLSLKGVAHKMG
jgi:hypothetical protein